jgi:sulfur carrier protein
MSDTLGHDGPCPAGEEGIVMVTVNGRGMHVSANISVAVLLESLGYPARGVAVALNQSVLPRSAWQMCLSDGARLDILTAVQGG